MSLIKLEIAVDYPIAWNFNCVFRDLIQNFYDSLTPEKFSRDFFYQYTFHEDGYHVIMETKGTEFSYEWLTYVGGSTKIDKDGYIGKYGEGFKMAALRIMQMGGMSLTMHSQNWMISPVEYFETVDGCEISMLGYEYEHVENDGTTRLEIIGIQEKYVKVLDEALLDFFYPENELFGRRIGKGKEWEIYERSRKDIPCRQFSPDLKGILYVNNLARGRLDIPLIINYKTQVYYDSRSRETFFQDRTISFLHEAARKFDSETSLYLLEMLEKKWNEYPKDSYDIETKYYLICQLVRNVAKDEETAAEFLNTYQNLGYIERKTDDFIRNKLIDETKVWEKEHHTRRIVNPVFRLLNACSLVEEYLKIRDSLYQPPTELERKRAGVLFEAVNKIIPLELMDHMPEIYIDESANSGFHALQFAEKKYVRIKGQINKKFRINRLLFRHEDFLDDAYGKSLLKMAGALLHIYGSERSSTLTVLFTHLGEWMLDKIEIIHEYEEKWSVP